MTNTKILSVFAIVAVAAMMGAASIAPAYAAQKTTDTRSVNHFDAPLSGIVCGIDSDFTVSTWIVSFTKIWDNGKFKSHIDVLVIVTDDNDGDAVVATQEFVRNVQGTVGLGGVQSIQLNNEATCEDGTTILSIHIGNTLHKDGTFTDHHISFI